MKHTRTVLLIIVLFGLGLFGTHKFNVWYYHNNLSNDNEVNTFKQELNDVLIKLTKKIIKNEAKISDLNHQLKMQDKLIEQMMMDQIKKEGDKDTAPSNEM